MLFPEAAYSQPSSVEMLAGGSPSTELLVSLCPGGASLGPTMSPAVPQQHQALLPFFAMLSHPFVFCDLSAGNM